jgi:hypothetical protein
MSTLVRTLAMAGLAVSVVAGSYILKEYRSPPGLSYHEPIRDEIRIGPGPLISIDALKRNTRYIAEPGSHVVIQGAIGNPQLLPIVEVIARHSSQVDVTGTNVHLVAQSGANVTARDGVTVDAEGAILTLYGDVRSTSTVGTVVHNHGTGDAYVSAGAVAYTDGKGRTIAGAGSTVHAKSPQDCDACTQVIAMPDSTVYVGEGAEAFATRHGGVTFYIMSGGEAACTRHCIAYVYPGAETKFGSDVEVHLMSQEPSSDGRHPDHTNE